MILLLAGLLGVIAGLRTMMAPTVLAWAAWAGWLSPEGTWAAFMASPWAVGVLSLLALVELVVDQLPSTESRKVPVQFGARLVSGAFCGAVLGTLAGQPVAGLLAGLIGAGLGTLGGAAARARLAAAFGRDMPAAFIEDAVAILGGLLIVAAA
ncbi:DUF4126 family protein [Paroceanicella profunda]|uniref:DUF4126 family protein n=2 Tax=Paroceanicella profunda TaxID=2579971 RepID=A0A5B8FYC4_9RHOB|nr:DUF4126 family protein [Paroceanicella profunda]